MRTAIKETTDEKYLREFINHVCEGDLAKANASLDCVVKEKIKSRIRENLQKEND